MVSGEENMMQEIYQRGPIACGIAVPDSLEEYTGGIYKDTTGDQNIVHDISVVGFGVENGVKFWTVRNSWGSHFGNEGFFRVERGINNIAIESDCSWATVKDTWTDDQRHKLTAEEKNDPRNPVKENLVPEENFLSPKMCREERVVFPGGEKRPEVHSWEELSADQVPNAWDWGNVNGKNYLSW